MLRLLSRPERLLSTLLLCNTLVNITAAAVATGITASLLPGRGGLSLTVAVGTMTFLLLVFGEISPKTFAVTRAEKWSSLTSVFLAMLVRVFSPVTSVLSGFSGMIVRSVGLSSHSARLSREEIIALVELGRSEGLLGLEGGATVNLLTLHGSQCAEVMRPRSEVTVLRTGWSRDRFAEVMKQKGYSRFPLLDGPMEKVAGYVDSREFFLLGDGEPLPLHFLPSFPENATLENVLNELRDIDEETGAVFDEYGDWAGMVTLHDILDFFLFRSAMSRGSLPPGISVREGLLEIPAALKISVLTELAGKELQARFAESCGGLLMELSGRIPEEGEEFEISGYLFRVLSRKGPKLERLAVRPPAAAGRGS